MKLHKKNDGYNSKNVDPSKFLRIGNKFVNLQRFLQVLRAFGIPQRKHLYFISVSGAFLGTSLPPTPNWSRFDLFIDVYSIFTVFFTLFIVFLATHCILFIFLLAISFFESKVVICLCSAYAYAVFMLMPCLCLCSVFPAWCVLV